MQALFLIMQTFSAPLFVSFAECQTNLDNNMNNQFMVQNQSGAIDLSSRLTRLNEISTSSSATNMTVAGDNTPFLARDFENRSVWSVEYSGVSLKLKLANPKYVDKYRQKRTFTVWLDAKTGQLLKIRSKFQGEAGEMRQEPSADSAESQLRAAGEFYSGLPNVSVQPRITFLDAVDAVLSQGIGSPLAAKEIDGLCVMHSKMGSTPRLVWVVTLRGLPPIPAKGPQGDLVPAWQRNHIRNVVDAVTGKCLFATNVPQPD
jgi:hypothetical protein